MKSTIRQRGEFLQTCDFQLQTQTHLVHMGKTIFFLNKKKTIINSDKYHNITICSPQIDTNGIRFEKHIFNFITSQTKINLNFKFLHVFRTPSLQYTIFLIDFLKTFKCDFHKVFIVTLFHMQNSHDRPHTFTPFVRYSYGNKNICKGL